VIYNNNIIFIISLIVFKGFKDLTFYLYYFYFKLLILIIKEGNKVTPSLITSRGIRA